MLIIYFVTVKSVWDCKYTFGYLPVAHQHLLEISERIDRNLPVLNKLEKSMSLLLNLWSKRWNVTGFN